ncbi:MAG: S49 family peptidase [Rhabdochlamydiaceae bacterium]|nr:S49 family peptidase [Candidatus Amphrikana amoebophyrae]
MQFKRESIFISAIRSFTKVLCGFIGLIIGAFILFFITGSMGPRYIMPKTAVHVVPNGNGITQITSDNSPLIVRINIEGVIGGNRLDFKTMEKTLSHLRTDYLMSKRLAAIFLYINSPGGLATDSAEIYTMLKNFKEEYKIPMYAYVNGLCASGGMYIACAADKIYANDSSIIGSVGVRFGPIFNFYGAMQKIGIESTTLTQGKDKDTLNPFRPWKQGEAEDIIAIGKDTYDQFISVVSQNRPKLTKELLINEYGAQVFSAKTSEKYGYIDHSNSDYMSTLSALALEAKIKKDQPYQVLEVKSVPSLFTDFVEQKSSSLLRLIFGKGGDDIQAKLNMSDQLLYLYEQ